MKVCKIEGCDKKHLGHGWCSKHYYPWKRNGDPLTLRGPSGPRPLAKRFERGHIKTDTCWLWTGAKTLQGYGAITKNSKVQKAHRVSYEMHKGPIPAGMCVLHTCDEPSCVNPDHLWLGTRAENNKDKMEKGRSCHGERHPHAKLCDLDVWLIRNTNATAKQKAEFFDVALGTVRGILYNQSWKHVN